LDDELIEKARSGNDHAFRIIVEKYRNLVFHTVYGVLRNEKDAEDAAQEVFLKIYTSLPQYEKKGFTTWVTRIAVNHAIDIKRKKWRRHEEMHVEYEETSHAPPGEGIELLVIKREKKQLIRERLNELPANYRVVVEGFYIEDKSYEELAAELNLKAKTVEVRLYRARQWMKKHWKEDDFS
jgi:RNA polymerase sigma factor (sigma-70 family)